MIKNELEPNEKNITLAIKNDILKRNSKLVMLSKMLVNIQENIIISIDGKWGSGKTFFVKQFKYLIEHINDYEDDRILNGDDKIAFKKLNDTHLVVYYNAWENDMHNNVLESLIFNILNEYPNMKNQIANFSDFKDLFKSFCRDFLYSISNETIDINNFDNLKSFKDLSKNIITTEEKIIAFNKLIDEILDDKQRIILIIDELDRCKPSFAVDLLETIKHFYINDKISIIVSTNNKELSNTIMHYYGNNFDGYGYLNKFYDLVISLEMKSIKPYLQNQFNFCNNTFVFHDMSYLAMEYCNFSLRECNRYLTFYSMMKSYIEIESPFDREIGYIHTCIFIPLAIALKISDIYKYNDFINKNGQKVLFDFIDKEITGTDYERWIRELIKCNQEDDFKQKIYDTYLNMFENEYSYNRFPFFDAISLLGTRISINDKNE